MSDLTKNEETMLFVIWRLKDDAYGVKINDMIFEITRKNWNYGTIYRTLDQLVNKNFARKSMGEPLPEPGGRSKIFYELTSEGMKKLVSSHKLHKNLWEGIPDSDFKSLFAHLSSSRSHCLEDTDIFIEKYTKGKSKPGKTKKKKKTGA